MAQAQRRLRRRHLTASLVRAEGQPWYVDMLNITLEVQDPAAARGRIERFTAAFAADGIRITGNLDFR